MIFVIKTKMKSKIFIFIVTFSIAQGKLKLNPPLVHLGKGEIDAIEKKINGFADSVTLKDTESSWENQKFQQCYEDNGRGDHLEAVWHLYYEMTDASETLNQRLPKEFSRRAQNVHTRAKNLTRLVRRYQKEFAKQNYFGAVEMYKDSFEDDLKDLFIELKGIEKSTQYALHLGPIDTCRKTFEEEIKKVMEKCEIIVKKIKACMEGKPFEYPKPIPVKSDSEDFADTVLLSDAKTLWDDERFQQCYRKRNSQHKTALATFALNTLTAGNNLKNHLININSKRNADKVQNYANDLGTSLTDYQIKFFENVNKKDFKEVEKLLTESKRSIMNKYDKLIKELKTVTTSVTYYIMHLQPIQEVAKTINNEIEEVKNECEEVMDILKKCVEKNKTGAS